VKDGKGKEEENDDNPKEKGIALTGDTE